MTAEYDNLLKYLAENFAAPLASWLLGRPVVEPIRLLKTELSVQPIRSDFLAQFDLGGEILHVEFETDPGASEPPLPLRMLDYFVRTYRRERKLVRQAVIVLAETGVPIPTEFRLGETYHRYRVVKMWEQDPEPLLDEIGLAPLAVLARSAQPEELAQQVADRVQSISQPSLRGDLTAAAFILSGLRLDKALSRRLFREEIMIQSTTYQYILEKGEARGEMRGEARGEARGKLDLIQRQVARRFGPLSESLEQRLAALDVEQLDALAELLLDFNSTEELLTWLNQQDQTEER